MNWWKRSLQDKRENNSVLRLSAVRSILCLVLLTSWEALAQNDITFSVALDGSGDYTSIQEAIDNSKAFPDTRVTIYIKNGIYNEKVKVHSWNTNLSLIGEDRENTIIRFGDYFDKIDRGRNSTFFTYTVLVQANDFYAEELTIENIAGPVGQAVALHIEADRCSIVNCNLKGNQDTLYAAGENMRQYFKNCYIEGTTDFIFGAATAIFAQSVIHIKSNSYITAASTPEKVAYGFVFMSCRITTEKDAQKAYLGRPWRNYAKTAFINCEMAEGIAPEGWHNWNKPEAEKLAFYAEYNSTGGGENPEKRAFWSHQLTQPELRLYDKNNIFRGWIPAESID